MTRAARDLLYRDARSRRGASASPRGICRAHDDGELYLQYSLSEAFGFDDGRLKTADYNNASGFGLRGVTGRDHRLRPRQ